MLKLTSVLSGLFAVAAFASASAQDLIPVNSIKYAGRYDLATGTFFPSDIDPDVGPGDSNPTILYDNTATNGFLTTSSGAITTHHFMDWGTPSFGGSGAVIDEIRIAYATNQLAAAGVVTLRVRLTQGATGFGVMGTVIGDYSLVGLPNSVSGGYEGYLVDVTLPAPLNIADGALGWSYNVDTPVGGSITATGPLLCGPPVAAGIVDAYDRYLEATDAYVGSFFFGGTPFASFAIRLKGRANGGGPSAWANYGTKNKVTLTGAGSGTPGSVDGVITIKNNPGGKSVVLVAGLVQSDIFQPHIGLQFYAFPWIIQLAPIVTPIIDGTVALPAPLDISLTPGTQIFLQAFGQNLSNQYKNWSEGLQLTIQ